MTTNPPTILSFDTATEACSVALRVDEKIFSRFEIAPRQHASLLLPLIQSLLNEAKITLQEINAIAFGFGPGSFMGVRLATGMAQGLAFGLQIPVIPISTLQIIAQTAHEKSGEQKILAGWDARMHAIYWGFYAANDQGLMQPQQPDALSAPASIDTNPFSTVRFMTAGNAWSVYENELPTVFLQQNKLNDIYPEASHMLAIAVSKYLSGDVFSPEKVEPQYIRHHVVN